MKRIHSSFRASISQAMNRFGVSWRFFRDECDYDELLEEVDQLDDPRRIAVMALLRLCDGSARTIDKALMMAIVDYLDVVLQPAPRSSNVDRLRALLQRYPSDEHDYADWIAIWYQ